MDVVKICGVVDGCEDCPKYGDDCDGDKMTEHTDLISRADAIEAMRLETSKLGRGLLGRGDILDIIEALTSADAVDCTDFIEWLVDRVLDETIWEYNSVAYGEIICRKLEKLGVLEVTEEPSYYIRPSAEAVQGWIPCSERLPNEGQGVIVTVDDNVYEIKVGSCIYSSGRFHSLYNDLTVTAWMPLPKPYKGGDDE